MLVANYSSDPEATRLYTLTVSAALGKEELAGVSIVGKSGHGGITGYSVPGIASGTQVTLEAPLYIGSGLERKRFESWAGSLKGTDPVIYFSMDRNIELTAYYVSDPLKIIIPPRL